MRSYLEILMELQKTVNADKIPLDNLERINMHIQELVRMLWKYSD